MVHYGNRERGEEVTDVGSVKSVYIFTDLEGVAGIDDWDTRHSDYAVQAKGVFERSEMQRLLTGEINAACEGLFAAGVTEIMVNDSHGAGRTILVEELMSGVKIARGVGRTNWMLGLSPRFDALIQVGMHAMAYTPNACLCHTMSRGKKYRVNGREVGEMEMSAYLTGMLGIPWVFTSGDLHACREAEAWVPGDGHGASQRGLWSECGCAPGAGGRAQADSGESATSDGQGRRDQAADGRSAGGHGN